MYIEVSFF